MSLNGKLEDVSLADVMQFVHLGRRTGTLTVLHGADRAEIGFHRGQLVSARTEETETFGRHLVATGRIDEATLDSMTELQALGKPRQSLAQVFVSSGALALDDLRQAMAEQIESTILQLVSWTAGTFEFALDELKPIDDLAMYPGDVIPKLDLNTEMVLLEATRIFDEKYRGREAEPASEVHLSREDELRLGESRRLESVVGAIEGLEVSLDEDKLLDAPAAAHRRLQVVSADTEMVADLQNVIDPAIAVVVRVRLREAGTRLPGEPTPTIVVLDLRSNTVADLLSIRRSRSRSSVIAIVESPAQTKEAFENGAVAAISPDSEAVSACFHSLVRTLQEVGRQGGASETRAGFARLRRVLADIRSGLLSATMALNLMHIISESVERAVLFLVRRQSLTALGAFGFGADGKPLAEATRALTLEIGANNALTRCIDDGQPRALGFQAADLPGEFAELLGEPRNGQIVVFPVLGAQRVISVVYTDNGSIGSAIEDIELLELATAQVGVAFENELLRRQIDQH